MSFHEVRFPTGISYGSDGGPGFNTNIIALDSGAEERVARRETAKHIYDVGYGIKDQSDLAAVKTFFMARGGAVHGFRFKDWSDFTSATDGISSYSDTDQTIGVGDGTETDFQLVKNIQAAKSLIPEI